MTTEFRIAVIGCGPNTPGKGGAHSIGYAHAWAANACKGVKLTAVADIVKKNSDDFVGEFPGTKGFTDYKTMLKESPADIVSVCAFPGDREPMVLAAIESGAKGVWIEKPLALSLGAAKRMMAAAQKRGTRLFVNHQRRYGKPFEWLRDAAKKGIGDVIGFDIAQPFETFIDFGPHLVDAALYCFGERRAECVIGAVDMTKCGNYKGVKTESHLIGSVHFTDGVRLSIEAGPKACSKLPILRLNGTQGFAELHLSAGPGEKSVFHARFIGEMGMSNPATDEHFHHSDDPALYIKRALADIVTALQTGAKTRIDVENAYPSMEIILAVYESARLRRMVSLPLEQDEFPFNIW